MARAWVSRQEPVDAIAYTPVSSRPSSCSEEFGETRRSAGKDLRTNYGGRSALCGDDIEISARRRKRRMMSCNADVSRLAILYLGGNRLREIPATIGQLRALTSLSLCDNRLETLPSTIAHLEQLESLALHNNLIRVRPHSAYIVLCPFRRYPPKSSDWRTSNSSVSGTTHLVRSLIF